MLEIDICTGTCMRTLVGHSGSLIAICVSNSTHNKTFSMVMPPRATSVGQCSTRCFLHIMVHFSNVAILVHCNNM